MTRRMPRLALIVVGLLFFAFPTFSAGQQVETILHNFLGGSDGSFPVGGLIGDGIGNLYGTTQSGGTGTACGSGSGCGTVFEISPPGAPGGQWAETVLYSFQGGNDGAQPLSGLVFDAQGNLFGTTQSGGTANWGTVFELSPVLGAGWTEQVIYSFRGNGSQDGEYPIASLVLDSAGNLYGTTEQGGITRCNLASCGTVFELSPPPQPGDPWTETVLYKFHGPDGYNPQASLILDSAGNLYGTTATGGNGPCSSRNFPTGCGVVFELHNPGASGGVWAESVLYNFQGKPDGSDPVTGVVFDSAGNLYGTTEAGGVDCGSNVFLGCGTVFQLVPSGGVWTENQIFVFGSSKSTGAFPKTPLSIDSLGNLYGTTLGDVGFARGNVFELSPSGSGGAWVQAVLFDFPVRTEVYGSDPEGGLVLGPSNTVYGTTNLGGSKRLGTVFSVPISSSVSLIPNSLNFENQTVGIASKAQIVTLTNIGNAPLNIASIAVTGSDSGDFSQTTTCSGTVAVNGKCTIAVAFTPTTTGTRSAQVTITDNALKSPQQIALMGTGVVPTVTFTPPSLTFPTQLVFTRSAPRAIQLGNTGLGILNITGITLSGQFSQTNNCPTSLNIGTNCTFQIVFQPTLRGPLTGLLTIADNAPGGVQTASITGVGTFVQLNPTSVNFGNQPLNTTSAPQNVVIKNQGNATISISSISILGGNASDFSQTNNCGGVASGATCMITITFTPAGLGDRSARLAISDNGGGSPQSAPLSGNGT